MTATTQKGIAETNTEREARLLRCSKAVLVRLIVRGLVDTSPERVAGVEADIAHDALVRRREAAHQAQEAAYAALNAAGVAVQHLEGRRIVDLSADELALVQQQNEARAAWMAAMRRYDRASARVNKAFDRSLAAWCPESCR